MLKIAVISLFPALFEALNYGVVGRGIRENQLDVRYFNPRDFSRLPHRRVDDRPYGGGPGMVMLSEPLVACIETAKQELDNAKVVYLSPQGVSFNQELASAQVAHPRPLILICGRYEGIDQRIIDFCVEEEWSIGDYVLSGGEFAALCIIDAITRLQPGILGHKDSAVQDSFSMGTLDYPHYTRPPVFRGQAVPSVLMEGNHQAIAHWRREQALLRTQERRPDLLERLSKPVKDTLDKPNND